MAGGKRTCSSCGGLFIGRSGALFCGSTCRQRARRGRKGAKCDIAVTDSAAPAILGTGLADPLPARREDDSCGVGEVRSAESSALLAELDGELADASDRLGQKLTWSAQERAILGQLSSLLDRKAELLGLYANAPTANLKLKFSAEVRLLEQAVARLVRMVKTDLAPAESLTTVKARRAARRRWDRDASA